MRLLFLRTSQFGLVLTTCSLSPLSSRTLGFYSGFTPHRENILKDPTTRGIPRINASSIPTPFLHEYDFESRSNFLSPSSVLGEETTLLSCWGTKGWWNGYGSPCVCTMQSTDDGHSTTAGTERIHRARIFFFHFCPTDAIRRHHKDDITGRRNTRLKKMDDFLAFERSYKREDLINWSANHVELPVFAVAFYVVMVFYGPNFVKKPYNLKPLLAAWNLILSIFSIVGASRCVPKLLEIITRGGWAHSVCGDTSYLDGASGLWMSLFIYSKFFELIDTAFLVLHKRKVIFLHWFHHLTVLLYCWHAYCNGVSMGLWFATMNYCVHSVMYFYYFVMVFRGARKYIRPFAPLITCIQLSQMVGGIAVNVHAAATLSRGEPCAVHPSTWKLGLGMYACYFILFAMLFNDKFIRQSTKPSVCDGACNATDAAGMFRTESSANLTKKTL